jgi:RNA polymerase sigma-70 factor, ECF subfamily
MIANTLVAGSTGAPQVAPPPLPECARAPLGVPRDAGSRAWVARLRGIEPVRRYAIAELHERLRREARFEIRKRARRLPELAASDLDDLAVQAAGDALITLLRKLDDYRGDSQFWTWAKRFAQLEAPVSIRRHLGHERLAPAGASPVLLDPPATDYSPRELVQLQLLLQRVIELINGELTERQRTVVVEIAINGNSPAALASQLHTTPGAIYKTLHDARAKLKAQLALARPDVARSHHIDPEAHGALGAGADHVMPRWRSVTQGRRRWPRPRKDRCGPRR